MLIRDARTNVRESLKYAREVREKIVESGVEWANMYKVKYIRARILNVLSECNGITVEAAATLVYQ